MKKLEELYPQVGFDVLLKNIVSNVDEVSENCLFVCTVSDSLDNHNFIDEAVKRGASCIIVSKDVGAKSVPVIKVPDTNRELPFLCQKFYDYPDLKLKTIGITGTDGKTSVGKIIQTLIGSDVCGYLGTNEKSCAKFSTFTKKSYDCTTIYNDLAEFLRFGCQDVVIEASSEALSRGQLQAFNFDMSLFTNISSEHLNIHGTFDNYLKSKLNLFRQTKNEGFCILNKDDKFFDTVKNYCNGQVLTYGIDAGCDLQIVSKKFFPTKTEITFKYHDTEYNVESPLLGGSNVYNLACAILATINMGISIDNILKRIKDIKIEGKLEILNTNTNYYVMVDDAHTINSIFRLLDFVHLLDVNRVIVVFGIESSVDKALRPKMGNIIVANATYAIFTSSGKDASLVDDVTAELKNKVNNYEIELDRRRAIQKAIDMALEKDIVVILRENKNYELENLNIDDIKEAYSAVANRKIREEN